MHAIVPLCDSEHDTVVVGDINENGMKQGTIATELQCHGLKQLVKEPTHIFGKALDHVYVNKPSKVISVQVKQTYFSDHDAVIVMYDL